MTLQGLGAHSVLGHKPHRRAEEVMKKLPFGGIEIIEERNNGRISESVIAQPLSDMSPVLLLHMGIIVLMVDPASGKLDRLFSLGNMPDILLF
jgi:hypothetical protein